MADHTPLEAPAHDPQSLPVQVPPKLIGREVLLAKIYGDLKKDDAVLLYGDTGVGKTALAATLASAYSELAGGVLWLSVDGDSLETLIARAARAYQRPDIANYAKPATLSSALENLLAERKPLIVIDGHPDLDAAAEFVELCASDVPVLITSDEPYDGPWTKIELLELDSAPANALYRSVADTSSEDEVAPLIDALGGIPLALVVAAGAAKASKQSAAEFLASMPKAPGVNPPAALLTLTTAFRGLPNALQGLILMLGATPRGQGSSELLSMVSGAAVEGLNQAMSLLVSRRLVERYQRAGITYYRLHPLVKDFAENWLRGSNRLEGLQRKVHESMTAYASRFSSQPMRLALEIENFQAVAEEGGREVASQIFAALTGSTALVDDWAYGYELGLLRNFASPSATTPAPTPPNTAFPAFQSTPAPATAPSTEDPFDDEFDDELEDDFEDEDFDDEIFEDEDEDEALFDDDEEAEDDLEDDLPIVRQTPLPMDTPPLPPMEMGEMARLRAALMQARQTGDQRAQATTLKAIGGLQQQDGMDNEAISTYTEALAQFETVNDRGEMLDMLEKLAELEVETDNLSAAALHAARGAELADQLGDTERQTSLLILLGDARQQLGESEAAVKAYDQAQSLIAEAGDARAEAVLLFKLGYALLDNNDPKAASETWETALKMFKEQGRRDYEGRVLGGLGTAYGDMERWVESINFHTSAFYIAREVGDKREEALQLSNLGYASVQAKQLGQAVLRYRQALHLAYSSGSRDDIVSTTVDLANVLAQSPKHLTVAQLIVDSALKFDPNDRDLRRLKETITTDLADAEARGVNLIDTSGGSAEDYARNAYELLDEA
jgi:tetratricopeptide (TPR) repeat protein/energy-coupling factor transporter ATP-binding protein EcfA2